MASVSTVCSLNQCAGCMACTDICPKGAIAVRDDIERMNASIDSDKCIECNLCHLVCQQNNPADLRTTVDSYQGWADDAVRRRSSSGGFASAIMNAFVDTGGVVVSCRFSNGEFRFDTASCQEEVKGFAGSKYVKSNPEGAYEAVLAELDRGKKVLFVALPCQVSSMRNYIRVRKRSDDHFYSIDLICHGTPSAEILRLALREYGYVLEEMKEIRFRIDARFGLRANETTIAPFGMVDRYSAAFLHGGCYTENCYSCYYAQRDRVGDLTLGDSWGTELVNESAGGISLALVQTEKGESLIKQAELNLLPVDYENAVAHNWQLQRPFEMGSDRAVLFSRLSSGRTLRSAVLYVYPRYCMRQLVKGLLGHLRMGGSTNYGIAVTVEKKEL